MSDVRFRSTYVSLDCYGTLINWQTTPTTKELVGDMLDATADDFLHVSSHTRYDPMPAEDLGFKNKVLLDRGVDPHSPAYNYVTVKSLDEVNTMLGI